MEWNWWFLAGVPLGYVSGRLIARLVFLVSDRKAMKKNRKKNDPPDYYSNRVKSDAAKAAADLKSLAGAIGNVNVPLHINVPSYSFDGRYRGGAQAYRVGTAGSPGYSSSYGSGAGTSASVKTDEFSGTDLMLEPALEEVGFAAGVVRGVRAFDVDALGRLRGVTYKHIWTPGENRAECRRGDTEWSRMQLSLSRYMGVADSSESNDGPHSMNDCKHGFYAYYDGSNDYHDKARVSAVIEGYGEAVIGSRGFRCMKARIIALHIPETLEPHLARMVARNYPDVPVMDTFDQLVSEFPPDGGGNEMTPETDPDFWTRSA